MLKENNTLDDAINTYYDTHKFRTLAPLSQKHYMAWHKASSKTKVSDKYLGEHKLKNIGSKQLNDAYEKWLLKGIRTANQRYRSLSVVFTYCRKQEVIPSNPMGLVDMIPDAERNVRWTQQQIQTYLEVGYSEYKWRSLALMGHLCARTGQRLGDMRELQWSNINFETKTMHLIQSKTQVPVTIPLRDSLLDILKQQQETFREESPYVCVRPLPVRNQTHSHYRSEEVSRLIKPILKQGNLPPHLLLRDLRRTLITRAVEAGVDIVSLTQVTGHKNITSLRPYIQNTLAGATSVLDKVDALDGE